MQKKVDWQKVLIREKVVDGLRGWLKREGFHEVDTPLLLSIPTTEPYYDLLETEIKIFNEAPRKAYLAPSPELQMKQIVAAGVENIFQISKVMRNNEGRSPLHNSEFTMLEFYRSRANYRDIMNDLTSMIGEIGRELGHELAEKKFTKISVVEAFEKWAKIGKDELLDEKELLKKAKVKGYEVDKKTTYEEIFNQILSNEIEPHLGEEGVVFLYDYPAQEAALAKLTENDERLAERAELWIEGVEIANIYSELIDAEEQEARIKAEIVECQRRGKKEITDYDREFVASLGEIEEPLAGVAVGVDRLAMVFTGASSISEITWFPTESLFK
ncbi:hypothetical protein FWH30_01130 [Microgenomates group bacterium]|nr:hypothetical protein [Microgenomates group bacterium]